MKLFKYFILFLCSVNLFANLDFYYPDSTPAGTPDLSATVGSIESLDVVTDKSGKYVYALWLIEDDLTLNYLVKFNKSSDNGSTWGSEETLSDSGNDSYDPNIAIDDTGKFVYLIWEDEGKDSIILKKSSNHASIFSEEIELTVPATRVNYPQITTDSTGEYLHATWGRYDGFNYIVQVSSSSNYGDTWSTPSNLSDIGESSYGSGIVTDATGKHVYALWRRDDIVQVSASSDRGISWSMKTDLSVGGSSYDAQIITDKTGEYVYAIWQRRDVDDIIQVSSSSDYGDTWSSVVDLSESGENAHTPKIVIDDSGKYVYATWYRYDGNKNIVQFSKSSDYGETWPAASEAVDLSEVGKNSLNPEIAADATGKYVYVIWSILEAKYVIQVAISDDYGENWGDPDSTPQGTPILSDDGHGSDYPQIVSDSAGQYVHAIWSRSDIIQAAFAEGDIFSISYQKYVKSFLFQHDNVNKIIWGDYSKKSYRLYWNSLDNLIYEGTDTYFYHHGRNANVPNTYYWTWIDTLGNESTPIEIIVP